MESVTMKTNIDPIIALRHDLHRHPELSMEEHETKNRLIHFLQNHTSAEIHDQGTWLYCITGKGKPGPAVAFRAEMDALPMTETMNLPYASVYQGAAHKCGHDGHMAALCALAVELECCPLNRPVYLIFQPGEETGSGGKACSEFVKKEGIREIYACHNLEKYPENSIVIREGLTQPASEGLSLIFKGKCSHASEPEAGINPAEVIARTSIYALEQASQPHRGMVLCTIVGMQAGTGDFGISAGEGSLSLTLRAENEKDMLRLEQAVRTFAAEEAKKAGLTFTWHIQDFFPETRNTPAALENVRQAAKNLNLNVIEMDHLWRASEDFGWYTRDTDGAIFYIGTGEAHAPLHTDGYDFNDHVLETIVDMMKELVYLTE